METRELKLGFWYWFWYGYLWLLFAFILALAILLIIGVVPELMVYARAAIVIPFGLWWGFRELRREKAKAIQKLFGKE